MLGSASSLQAYRPAAVTSAVGRFRAFTVAGWALLPPLLAVSALATAVAALTTSALRGVHGSGDVPVAVLVAGPVTTSVMVAVVCGLYAFHRPISGPLRVP